MGGLGSDCEALGAGPYSACDNKDTSSVVQSNQLKTPAANVVGAAAWHLSSVVVPTTLSVLVATSNMASEGYITLSLRPRHNSLAGITAHTRKAHAVRIERGARYYEAEVYQNFVALLCVPILAAATAGGSATCCGCLLLGFPAHLLDAARLPQLAADVAAAMAEHLPADALQTVCDMELCLAPKPTWAWYSAGIEAPATESGACSLVGSDGEDDEEEKEGTTCAAQWQAGKDSDSQSGSGGSSSTIPASSPALSITDDDSDDCACQPAGKLRSKAAKMCASDSAYVVPRIGRPTTASVATAASAHSAPEHLSSTVNAAGSIHQGSSSQNKAGAGMKVRRHSALLYFLDLDLEERFYLWQTSLFLKVDTMLSLCAVPLWAIILMQGRHVLSLHPNLLPTAVLCTAMMAMQCFCKTWYVRQREAQLLLLVVVLNAYPVRRERAARELTIMIVGAMTRLHRSLPLRALDAMYGLSLLPNICAARNGSIPRLHSCAASGVLLLALPAVAVWVLEVQLRRAFLRRASAGVM